MANFIDDLIASLQATPLIRGLQQTSPIQSVQNLISGWAAQNPTQAGNILSATGGSFGNIFPTTSANAATAVVNALLPKVQAAQTTVPYRQTTNQPTQNFQQVGGGAAPKKVQQKQQPPPTPTPTPQPQNNQTYDQILAAAKARGEEYYKRLLEESNWNLDQAKAKLEADYQNGLRQARGTNDEEVNALFGQTIPQEQMQTAEDLNKRGLLSTVTGAATQPTGKLSTGATVTPTNPVLGRSYGGLAGRQIGTMYSSQQARADAIARALSQREAELQLPYQQGIAANERARQQLPAALERQKNEDVGQYVNNQLANEANKIKTGLGTVWSS